MDTSKKTTTSDDDKNRGSLLSHEILERFAASMEVGEDSLIEACMELKREREEKARREKEKKG